MLRMAPLSDDSRLSHGSRYRELFGHVCLKRSGSADITACEHQRVDKPIMCLLLNIYPVSGTKRTLDVRLQPVTGGVPTRCGCLRACVFCGATQPSTSVQSTRSERGCIITASNKT